MIVIVLFFGKFAVFGVGIIQDSACFLWFRYFGLLVFLVVSGSLCSFGDFVLF